ncbi:MAG TPA: phospho-N-acetylmuramoyl-pentapeptide-transferase [Caldilineae bacterium]|nr:phospho-N-acetylmuramoyl-pentapeptide-transferase [Caldilineae bacterium]
MAYSLTLGTISFFLAVIWGRPLINLLKRYGIGKQIRIEGPSSHQVKTGTPTTGGLMIIIPVVLITGALNVANLLGFNYIGQSTLLLMGCMLMFGLLGFIDDLEGVRGKRARGEGLMARSKAWWQVVFATVIALVLYFGPPELDYVGIPTVREFVHIGPVMLPISIFIIVGASNAVNLSDGLDALAGSVSAIAFVAYGIIAHLQGQTWLVAFAFTVVGALLAFLWYNAHPAELFMGDTGALAVGATLGVVALMTGQWLLLPIIAIIPVAEALSVILQVVYFKYTKRRYGEGRRLFKMAPLHHHFELLGWSETQVVQRFWLVSILCAMLGIALALL